MKNMLFEGLFVVLLCFSIAGILYKFLELLLALLDKRDDNRDLRNAKAFAQGYQIAVADITSQGFYMDQKGKRHYIYVAEHRPIIDYSKYSYKNPNQENTEDSNGSD